jgi:hypothetical protein
MVLIGRGISRNVSRNQLPFDAKLIRRFRLLIKQFRCCHELYLVHRLQATH